LKTADPTSIEAVKELASQAPKPQISARNRESLNVTHRDMGGFQFFVEKTDEWIFTNKESSRRSSELA
jgi:hypothetical protein